MLGIPSKSMRGIPFEQRYYVARLGCWIWVGARNPSGYGVCYQLGENLAHRVSYRKNIGDIPAGQFVLHRCDNPRCVNPDHLELGNQKKNMEQMSMREHTNTTRLTADKVRAIRADPRRACDLARAYNVSHGAIQHIKKFRSWKHI
jgi:hypothetical protein